ncbi:cupin domain-containing protein [Acidithiobacillus acidisediminis]|uniref:cupin domain-containing protein n=1 Tax=Acidithiobacillus acidisediminis TaxID=2937799 RepID=UPI00200FFC3F|nr:cupin domain-containing protein [Acidithiobacillus sp. S30A2]
MNIYRVGSRPSVTGPEQYFTGVVRIDPLFDPQEPSRVLAAAVTFEPGARSARHSHPLRQHLVVTSGCGWTQYYGGCIKEIRAGDVVFCNCGQEHWHGATDTTAMSHIWMPGNIRSLPTIGVAGYRALYEAIFLSALLMTLSSNISGFGSSCSHVAWITTAVYTPGAHWPQVSDSLAFPCACLVNITLSTNH